MSSDFHGHDPIAEFLDRPRKGGTAAIVKALTGVVIAVLMCQAPECVKDRDCASGQRCVGGACKGVQK